MSKLKSLGIKYVISTNGFRSVSQETDFIKKVLLKRKVVLLLDPDGPGKKIADTILSSLSEEEKDGVINISLDKKQSVRNKKVGLFEASDSYIQSVLKDHLRFDMLSDEIVISLTDCLNLGFVDDSLKRKRLMEKYSFNVKSFKSFLNRINMLGLSKEDLYEKNWWGIKWYYFKKEH